VVAVVNLYLDDSGTRVPDRDPAVLPEHGRDWFALGGIMVKESEEDALRARHAAFCKAWNVEAPLHSAEIRARSQNFHWLSDLEPEKRNGFYDELGALATSPEIVAIACVIDRPGYNARYREKYGRNRWLLCRTAFIVVVERATKYARSIGHKLRVHVERSDKKTDATVEGYYKELRASGPPFDAGNSAKYTPLTAADYAETLYEFRKKDKTSAPMQLADVCLWPMCIGGYDPDNRPYRALIDARTLIDARLTPEQVGELGVKYSCMENVTPKKPKPDLSTGLGSHQDG
jgi:hypothetical protein